MFHRLRSVIAPVVCCLSLALAACGDDSGPAPVKHLYFSQDNNGNGLYELNLTTGTATLVGTGISGTTSSTIGLTETADPDTLIGSIWSALARIAADGSGATVVAGSAGVEALAMNVTSGILYGAINGAMYTLNPTTGVIALTLAAPGADVEGLASNRAGVIYGISGSTQSLYAYNIAGNSWSVVASTGRDWDNAGLAYDHIAGVLYAVEATTDALYTINPTTAATTLVGPLGVNGAGGLAFVVQ